MTASDTVARLVTLGLNDEPTKSMYDELPGDVQELKEIIAGLLATSVAALKLFAQTIDRDASKMWAATCLFSEIQRLKK